ncbi:MAG: Spy/CpxP family protein refolding chaperone [Bacteroidia bacterium]|nr:Spy/CpxP family protein refolding chaperone [Bacteroidia bacterium]
MKTTLKNSAMMLLILVFIGAGSSVFAQGKKEKDKEKKEEIKEVTIEKKSVTHDDKDGRLGIKGLTDEQKEKIKKMRVANRKEMMQYKNQLAEKKAHLKTLETTDNPDMTSINKTIDEMGAVKTEMLKKQAAHKQEIRKLLNDEQRLQFDMNHKMMKKNKKKKGPNAGKERKIIKKMQIKEDRDE